MNIKNIHKDKDETKNINKDDILTDRYNELWKKIWTVETEYYLSQGGQITKLICHLLLKCFNNNLDDIKLRPYVEWITVILSEVKTSLNGLY